MKLRDSIRRSSRSLSHAKTRTLLTVAAIAVGSFALALTLAAGTGARQFVDRLVTNNFDPQELVVTRGDTAGDVLSELSGTPREYSESLDPYTRIKMLAPEDIAKIRNTEGVEQVRETYSLSADYVTAADAKKYTAAVETYNPHMKPEIVAGAVTDDLPEGHIILPESYASVLGFGNAADAVGKQVSIHLKGGVARDQEEDVEYTVAAVAKKPSTLLGGTSSFLLSSADAAGLYDFQNFGTPTYGKYASVNVRVKGGKSELSAVKARLAFNGYAVASAEDIAKQVTQAVNIVQYGIAGFGIIALITSIFGIVNTQLISVLERTREIGLMKALGMSRRGVYRLFMLEATWIGFGGAVAGIFVAYVVAILANPWISDKLQLGGDLLQFQPVQMAALVVALMVIATLAGLVPAWKAARLNPVEALRTE